MRILITITPRLYREVLALCIYRRSPDFDVLLAPPGPSMGGPSASGRTCWCRTPTKRDCRQRWRGGVVCRIRILKTDRIDATIELDGTTSELRDACLEDMFVALEEAERLSQGKGNSGG